MIVWRDTKDGGKRRRPAWDDEHALVSMDADGGRLWTLAAYAEQLGRRDVRWYDVGDHWQAAQYLDFEPARWVRKLDCALVINVVDVDGEVWPVPAMLRPEGVPAIGMRHRAEIVDGEMVWSREAPTERMRRALDSCQELRPLAEAGWEGADREAMLSGLLAVIEAGFNLPAQTVAALGLIGDVLLDKGLAVACGVINEHTLAAVEADGLG